MVVSTPKILAKTSLPRLKIEANFLSKTSKLPLCLCTPTPTASKLTPCLSSSRIYNSSSKWCKKFRTHNSRSKTNSNPL